MRVFFLFCFWAAAVIASAQPLFTTLRSLELRTVNASAIFRATTEVFSEGRVTLKVIEVLKGKTQKQIRIDVDSRWGRLFAEWASGNTEFLWFVGDPSPTLMRGKAAELGYASTIRLGPAVPEEKGFKPDWPVISMDAGILSVTSQILERVRKWAKHPGLVKAEKVPFGSIKGETFSLLVLACRDRECCRAVRAGKTGG